MSDVMQAELQFLFIDLIDICILKCA